jgi:hypothetical protein
MKIDKDLLDRLEKRATDKRIQYDRVLPLYNSPQAVPPEYRDVVEVSTADLILLVGAVRAAGAVKE